MTGGGGGGFVFFDLGHAIFHCRGIGRQEKFYVIISLDFLYSIASFSFTSESVGWC